MSKFDVIYTLERGDDPCYLWRWVDQDGLAVMGEAFYCSHTLDITESVHDIMAYDMGMQFQPSFKATAVSQTYFYSLI